MQEEVGRLRKKNVPRWHHGHVGRVDSLMWLAGLFEQTIPRYIEPSNPGDNTALKTLVFRSLSQPHGSAADATIILTCDGLAPKSQRPKATELREAP